MGVGSQTIIDYSIKETYMNINPGRKFIHELKLNEYTEDLYKNVLRLCK